MNPINLFLKGAKLGKKLERITDYSARWKVIADFWSEMILFVAPSDSVRSRIQRLTHGGEFIYHSLVGFAHSRTHCGTKRRQPDQCVDPPSKGWLIVF